MLQVPPLTAAFYRRMCRCDLWCKSVQRRRAQRVTRHDLSSATRVTYVKFGFHRCSGRTGVSISPRSAGRGWFTISRQQGWHSQKRLVLLACLQQRKESAVRRQLQLQLRLKADGCKCQPKRLVNHRQSSHGSVHKAAGCAPRERNRTWLVPLKRTPLRPWQSRLPADSSWQRPF